MKLRSFLINGSLTTGLLLSMADASQAQLFDIDTDSFRRIEQSSGVKGAVTTAGIGLIGLELWWFLLSKAQSQSQGNAKRVQSALAESVTEADVEVLDPLPLELDIEIEKDLAASQKPAKSSRPQLLLPQSLNAGVQRLQVALTVEDKLSPRFSMMAAV